MKKYVWLMCLGLLLGCGREETKADVSGSPVVTQKTYQVTSYPYTPFVIRDGKGNVGGFETEILQAVAQKQNIRFEFKPMLNTWEMLFKSIENKQADLLSAAMYPNPERAARFEVSEPYMDTQFVLFVAKDAKINSLADLKDKRVAVFVKSMAEKEILSLPYADKITTVPIESIYEGVKAVLSGKADAVYGDQVVLTYYANQFRDKGVYLHADAAAKKQHFVFLISKGNTELLAQVNAGLAAIKADGTLDRIKRKWLEQ